MESLTYLKNLRVSPKKVRTFLPVVKKKTPFESLDFLFYSRQKAARMVYQAVKSAISNAKNTLKVSEDLLEWKLFTVEEGQKLKRYRPGSRGSAKPYKIRFSHIKIILIAKKSGKKEEKNLTKIENVKSEAVKDIKKEIKSEKVIKVTKSKK